jgi:hypothetical protein
MHEGQPYIAVQNVYVVPVVRNRLNFCVLVKRAFDELRLDSRDLIAVELPRQIERAYLDCVSDFPKVSLLLTSDAGGATQEVFTVTPCDAVAEATRTGVEAGIDVAFIDRSMSPRLLEARQCIENPTWPDDGLVLINGVDWYLSQVSALISIPPARSDPIDDWRESFMAMRLQELAPWYERIVVVCDLVHAKPIVARIQQPPDSQQLDADPDDALRVRRIRPNVPELLRRLDDIPRLVESYERKRRDALSFSKMREIVEIVHDLADSAPDMDFSIRNYEAFTTLLTKMSECQGRLSPALEDVRLAGVSCFNDAFGERIFRHLLGYFDALKVGRVKVPAQPANADARLYELRTAPSSAPEYTARNCNPWPTEYVIEVEPPVKADYRRGGHDRIVAWPPCDRFIDAMRRKAHRVLTVEKVETKSARFSGSIESGIDMRRTLRSQLLKRADGLGAPRSGPELYVRKIERVTSDDYQWQREPTVWILDRPADISGFSFTYSPGGEKTESCILDWRFSQEQQRDLLRSEDLNVSIEKTIGYLVLVDLTSTAKQLRATFGSALRRRVPGESDFGIVQIGKAWEDAPRALKDVEFEIESWWEALILAGLLYCESRLVCVAPADLQIPNRVLRYANQRRKEIHRVSLGAFEREEQRKLGLQYWVEGGWKPPRDSNDPSFHDYLIRKYGNLMTRYWGATTASEGAA